jgi:hypothetical protein
VIQHSGLPRFAVTAANRSARCGVALTGALAQSKTGQRQTGRSAILRVNADVTGGERPAPYSGRP